MRVSEAHQGGQREQPLGQGVVRVLTVGAGAVLFAGAQVGDAGMEQDRTRDWEITELFEETYYLNSNPRFNIVDYSIMPDRTMSSASPPEPFRSPERPSWGSFPSSD